MEQELKTRVDEFNAKKPEWWVSAYRLINKGATSIVQTAQGIIKDVVEYSSGLETKLATAYRAAENAKKEFEKISVQKQEELDVYEEKLTQKQEEISSYQKRIGGLEKKLTSKGAKIGELVEQVNLLNKQVSEYIMLVDGYESSNALIQELHMKTQTELAELKNRVEEGVLLEGKDADFYRKTQEIANNLKKACDDFMSTIGDRGTKGRKYGFREAMDGFNNMFGQQQE